MGKMKKIFGTGLIVALFVGMLTVTGCSGVSEEQIAELEALRSEVKALEKEVNSLKSEKAALEKEIAEKNAKLDECAKQKAETKKNLEKMGM
jgi:outer membrane murein-binding lipoprotein Lpp